MAHWAEIDENNIVLRVIVTDNNDPKGDEGYQWLVDNLGGRWIQTSYSESFRGKFAGVGDFYNEELDAFISPKFFESWTLNPETHKWEAPVPHPNDSLEYYWNEETQTWQLSEEITE
jgi:hypothetical protein